MDPERQEDVIDKQLVHLVGMAERRQYRRSETGNCGVLDSHGLMVQIANSRRVGIVSDRETPLSTEYHTKAELTHVLPNN